MKYIYIPVYARNIQYSVSTKKFLSDLLSLAETSEVEWWIRKKLDLYLRNEYKSTRLHKKYNPTTDEDWVLKALERGDEIYDINISSIDRTKIKKIILLLNDYPQQNKIKNVSFPQAEKMLEAVTKKQPKISGKLIHDYPNKFKWIELPADLHVITFCGELMQNCLKVGNNKWDQKVKDKKIRLLVLLDSNTKPHVAIEYNVPDKSIDQIKGKQNSGISSKYAPYLQDFLHKRYIKYKDIDTGDLLANGFYVDSNGDLITTKNSKEIVLDENLILNHLTIDKSDIWPAYLKVNGELEIHDCIIKVWPKKLSAESISLMNILAQNLSDYITTDYISFNGVTGLTHLPKHLKAPNIYIFDTPDLEELPNNFTADLICLTGSQKITKLPRKLVVHEDLVLINSNIEKLPADLIVKGTLYLYGSKVIANVKNKEDYNKIKIPHGVYRADFTSAEVEEW